jgi:hypothetical protein
MSGHGAESIIDASPAAAQPDRAGSVDESTHLVRLQIMHSKV